MHLYYYFLFYKKNIWIILTVRSECTDNCRCTQLVARQTNTDVESNLWGALCVWEQEMDKKEQNVDVVVVGGGISGIAAAVALQVFLEASLIKLSWRFYSWIRRRVSKLSFWRLVKDLVVGYAQCRLYNPLSELQEDSNPLPKIAQRKSSCACVV